MLGKTTALQYSLVTVHIAMPFAHLIAITTQYDMIPTQTRRRRVQGTGIILVPRLYSNRQDTQKFKFHNAARWFFILVLIF